MLHTETVEPSTLDLLKRLQRLPDLTNTRLVGGTALALHLGHLEIATRLVSDLWSAAHNGSPFPRMDRTVYSYITVAAKNAKGTKT